MPRVAVVTDSTAYLPAGVAEAGGITVVPLHVVLGAITGTENVDLSPADVARALHERRVQVSTSRPTPAELEAAYRSSGATQILSVHLSARLSGTSDSARLAGEAVAADGIEVRVVDSGSIAMGLGFPVIAGAEAAAAGGSLDEVESAVVTATARTTTLFYVDTLEHLRRGGRMTAASALVGAALGVKPLLRVKDGEIGLLEKVRTASRAVARMVAVAVDAAGDHAVEVAVHHLEAPDRAAQLVADLTAALPNLTSIAVSEIGAVVGAHTGPGCLGVVLWQR
ncbi:MAG: degV family protein [Frankiales bacterium]|nr:degV family protein [Frankiales bacterium]